jgi:Di-haem oxidoreductase, putative peroxidase
MYFKVQFVGPTNADRHLQVGISTLVLILALVTPFSGQDRDGDHGHGSGPGQNTGSPVDPGPRGAPVGAGGPIANLSLDQLRFFNDAAQRFVHSEGVANGLGPTFNADSCGICHSQPAIGGTSPSTTAFPKVGPNPQVALATANGGKNTLPFFVKADGPIREARFKFLTNPDGTVDPTQPDGSVHDLFTIQRRTDAPTACTLAQEDFLGAANQHNLALRIPTPTFGGGLIEMIDDATILTNMQASHAAKSALGISGKPNRSGNDATITRFGWKAQNKSLIMFSHEAYSVEIGETNQMFPQKRGFFPNPPPANCIANPLPEDQTNVLPVGSDTIGVPSDDDAFATFMRIPRPAHAHLHRYGLFRIHTERKQVVHEHGMRVVPHAVHDDGAIVLFSQCPRPQWCAGEPVFRLAVAPHGGQVAGRDLARECGTRRVSNRSVVGTRTAAVLSA